MNVWSMVREMRVPALACLFACGCSGRSDRPETYAVKGQVAYQGKAVEGATVAFWMEGVPRAAQGTTDQEGRFVLSTFELNDGAAAGSHKVTVSKSSQAPPPPTPVPGGDPADMTKNYLATMKQSAKLSKSLLPSKYSELKLTPLSAEVKAGDNEPFVFQLTD